MAINRFRLKKYENRSVNTKPEIKKQQNKTIILVLNLRVKKITSLKQKKFNHVLNIK